MVGGTKIKGPIIAHEVDQMNYIGCSVLCSRGEVLLSTAPEGRFLHRFGLKTGIYFAHFCPWNRVWFTTGTTFVYQCVRRFISKINKKESGICEIEMDFFRGILSNLFVAVLISAMMTQSISV